jgi:hypothetical protein
MTVCGGGRRLGREITGNRPSSREAFPLALDLGTAFGPASRPEGPRRPFRGPLLPCANCQAGRAAAPARQGGVPGPQAGQAGRGVFLRVGTGARSLLPCEGGAVCLACPASTVVYGTAHPRRGRHRESSVNHTPGDAFLMHLLCHACYQSCVVWAWRGRVPPGLL